MMPLALIALQTVERTFAYTADRPLKSVHLAGSFNNWDKGATPMTMGADGRTWTRTVGLPYGKVQYKFVVDGETWIVDPKGKTIDDGNGHQNSELTILPAGYETPAAPRDGKVTASALRHAPELPDVNVDRGRTTFRMRVRPDDVVAVELRPDGMKPVRMNRIGGDGLYDTYEAVEPDLKQTWSYRFALADGVRWRTFGADGLDGSKPFGFDPKTARSLPVPEWPERGVVYQIFPDRFANGDKRNDLPGTLPWNSTALKYDSRLGGDVAGLRQHLPYLERLGIRTAYYTPVFDSPSYHRYDARSYTKIAPDFGTNADFSLLTKQMRARGIRTVMDFAFNHTAVDGPWFSDLRKNGAASRYKDFYFAKSFPIQVKEDPNYVAWFGFPSMPKLNVVNPAVRDALLDSVDYWRQNASLAGVRLDVANEVDPSLWRALRQREKATSPDFWIVGENWGDGTPWFDGTKWDSQMGYQFRDAVLGFVAEGKTTPSQFTDRLMAVYGMYPPQVSRNLMTLIGSHDTPRFLTLCKGDGALARMGTAMLLTWPGAPMLYYGDELGMTGGADPMNRKGMEWNRANDANPTLRYVRRLIAVRNANRALQSGDPSILAQDDATRTLAYARTFGKEAAAVAVNRGGKPAKIVFSLPAPLKGVPTLDALTGRRYAPGATLSLNLGPKGVALLVPALGPNLAFSRPY